MQHGQIFSKVLPTVTMEPSGLYQQCIDIINLILATVGMRFLTPDFKPSLKSHIGTFTIILYYSACIYTTYYFWGEYSQIIECFCISTSCTQGGVKLYTCMKESKLIWSLCKFVRDVYELNEVDKSSARFKVITKWAKIFKYYIVGLMIVFCIAFMVFALYPLWYYIIYGERVFVLLALLPFVDYTTVSGYWLNMSSHMLYIITGFTGNLGHELCFLGLVLHIGLLVDLLEISLCEIDEILDDKDNVGEVEKRLRNSILLHQDIMRYVELIEKSFSFTIAVQISTNVMAISVALFATVSTDWLAAYSFAFMTSVQMLMYCSIGTYVEYMNDKINYIIYNLKWYKVPIKWQKSILITLVKTQNSQTLAIAGLAPLNAETGASLVKAIYTYFMMLLNFSE